MDNSEFNTQPHKIIVSNPRLNRALDYISESDLAELNFLNVPNTELFYEQYDAFITKINELGVTTQDIRELLEGAGERGSELANPNLMFVRDSAVTLPWAPKEYIPARFGLPSRQTESDIMREALASLDMSPIIEFEADEYLEGGDVLPAIHEGMRTLIIGFGTRTSQSAALKIASKLIPSHFDQILGLRHDPEVLHLDTGFTILPRKTIFAAKGMFNNGFVIDSSKRVSEVDPIAFAESLGFTIIRTTIDEAVHLERCNIVPMGNGNYISFFMPPELKQQLQDAAHIWIHEVDGSEISKATGGVHCLTRPLYL